MHPWVVYILPPSCPPFFTSIFPHASVYHCCFGKTQCGINTFMDGWGHFFGTKHLLAHFERILPLYDADAGPADGVLECQTQQRPRRPRGCGRGLFLGLWAVVLSLPLRGTGRGDGPAPSRPEPRTSTRSGVSHHLCLPCGVDGRLPAQRCPRCRYMLRGQAHHTQPVINASSSPSIVLAAAATVLIGKALGRRPRKRGRGGIVGAWREREGRERRKCNKVKLKQHRLDVRKL